MKKSIKKNKQPQRKFKICENCTKEKGIIMKDQDYKLTEDLIKAEVNNVLIPKIMAKYCQRMKTQNLFSLYKEDQSTEIRK